MNLFWILASGALFAASGVVFWKVLRSPSNTTKHLYEMTFSYLTFMVSGMVFSMMVAATFML